MTVKTKPTLEAIRKVVKHDSITTENKKPQKSVLSDIFMDLIKSREEILQNTMIGKNEYKDIINRRNASVSPKIFWVFVDISGSVNFRSHVSSYNTSNTNLNPFTFPTLTHAKKFISLNKEKIIEYYKRVGLSQILNAEDLKKNVIGDWE